MIPSDMEQFRLHMSTYVKPVRPDFDKLRKERILPSMRWSQTLLNGKAGNVKVP